MTHESSFDETTGTFRLNIEENEIGSCFSSDYLQARIATMASLIVPPGTPVKNLVNYTLDVRPIVLYGWPVGNWPHDGEYVVAKDTRGNVTVAEHILTHLELSGEDKKNGKISLELNNLEPGFYEFNINAFFRSSVRAQLCSSTFGVPIFDSQTANRPAYSEVDVFLGSDHVYDFSLTGERGWQARMYPIQVQ